MLHPDWAGVLCLRVRLKLAVPLADCHFGLSGPHQQALHLGCWSSPGEHALTAAGERCSSLSQVLQDGSKLMHRFW